MRSAASWTNPDKPRSHRCATRCRSWCGENATAPGAARRSRSPGSDSGHLPVEIPIAPVHLAFREEGAGPNLAALPKPATQLGVVRQVVKVSGQGGIVARGGEKTGRAL